MITVYRLEEDAMMTSDVPASGILPVNSMWIDILNPTPDEEKNVETQLGIEIPTREEVWKNEVLNRFYEENGAHYMTAAIITKVDSPYPKTSAITFILTRTRLLTIRYISPTSFSNFTRRLLKYPKRHNSSVKVLESLLEDVITRVAHNLEVVVNDLDDLSHKTFGTMAPEQNSSTKSAKNMSAILHSLGKNADLNSKICESLYSLRRLVHYFKQAHNSGKEMDKAIATLANDVEALIQQTHFLSDKIIFLQDAILGMINIEQNLIIKIFSVVTVFFMPPTLICTIYGMNFRHMPEINWIYGYPTVIAFMVLCSVVSYYYFRRKGWL